MDIDFDEEDERLLQRITRNPNVWEGKPTVRGRTLAVEHVLGMMIGGSTPQEIVDHYDGLELDDVIACLLYAQRLVEHEHEAASVATAQ